MTRLILFYSSFTSFLLIFTHSKAEEEWSIEELMVILTNVSGEIQYGDKFVFILMPEDNCNKITTMFYTWNDPGDYRQLIDKHIPIKLNNIETTAEVINIMQVYDGLKVIFTLGVYPIKDYTYILYNLYKHEKKYEIEIVDGINFKAKKYFDIRVNRWKLENLIPSIDKALKILKKMEFKNT